MHALTIRDPRRVRAHAAIMLVSLVLLLGYAWIRQYVGPEDRVPPGVYGVLASLVVAWGVLSMVSRSTLVKVGPHGIEGPQARWAWSAIRTAQAYRGELVVTGDARATVAFPPERTDDVNAAIARHQPRGRVGQ